VHSTVLDFAAREGIDIMVLGSKESKGTVQKLVQPGGMGASTSDTVKSKSKCPCLIVRPAVRPVASASLIHHEVTLTTAYGIKRWYLR
jgi:hypothetical protein